MNASIPIFANTGANPTKGTSEAVAANLRGQELQRIQRLRFMVWFLANALKGAGGTDYTTKLVSVDLGGLRNDANNALAGFDMDMLDAAEAFIYDNAASAAGSSPGADNIAWNSRSIALRDVSEQDLRRMKVWLLDLVFAAKF